MIWRIAQKQFARQYFISLLQRTHGNITHAARMSGVNRTHLYRVLQLHSLDFRKFRRG